VWVERLAVERPPRAKIVVEKNAEGATKWVELRVGLN